jgi:hypothetical protein
MERDREVPIRGITVNRTDANWRGNGGRKKRKYITVGFVLSCVYGIINDISMELYSLKRGTVWRNEYCIGSIEEVKKKVQLPFHSQVPAHSTKSEDDVQAPFTYSYLLCNIFLGSI